MKKDVYRTYNVAFHCTRENYFAPWDMIGVYATRGNYASSFYKPEFKLLEAEFHNKQYRDRVGFCVGTEKYLDDWRMMHQDPFNVITPIIKYRSVAVNSRRVAYILYHYIVDSVNPNRFFVVSLMLKKGEWVAGYLRHQEYGKMARTNDRFKRALVI